MKYNSVLKDMQEVDESIEYLKSVNLFPHQDKIKSWDTSKMIHILNKADRRSYVLDVGCNDCPILPMLSILGFKELYGCDMNLASAFISNLDTYGLSKHRLSIQNLENTTYENEMFDYITSLSVIEHGVSIEKYFKEMSRILKKEGLLLTSTDFWEEKLDTSNSCSFGLPDIIFSLDEIKDVINTAEKNGFELIEPMDFTCKEKFVTGFHNDVDYTFLFFGFKKIKSLQS